MKHPATEESKVLRGAGSGVPVTHLIRELVEVSWIDDDHDGAVFENIQHANVDQKQDH